MAVDIFLVIPGVKGETTDADFIKQNAIDVQSWSWGLAQAGSAGRQFAVIWAASAVRTTVGFDT